jgi:hypothetical protein
VLRSNKLAGERQNLDVFGRQGGLALALGSGIDVDVLLQISVHVFEHQVEQRLPLLLEMLHAEQPAKKGKAKTASFRHNPFLDDV